MPFTNPFADRSRALTSNADTTPLVLSNTGDRGSRSIISTAFKKVRGRPDDDTMMKEITGWSRQGEQMIRYQLGLALLARFDRVTKDWPHIETEMEFKPKKTPLTAPTKLTLNDIYRLVDDNTTPGTLAGRLKAIQAGVDRYRTRQAGVCGPSCGDYGLDWEELAHLTEDAVTAIEAMTKRFDEASHAEPSNHYDDPSEFGRLSEEESYQPND